MCLVGLVDFVYLVCLVDLPPEADQARAEVGLVCLVGLVRKIRYQKSEVRRQKARGRKSEIRYQRSDFRSQKSEIISRKDAKDAKFHERPFFGWFGPLYLSR